MLISKHMEDFSKGHDSDNMYVKHSVLIFIFNLGISRE